MSGNDTAIADLSKWAPPQRRRIVDGDPVIEKLAPCAGPKMLDPSGVVVDRLPLSNGIANRRPNDPYGMTILPEKLAAGWVYFGRCPLGVTDSVQHVPAAIRHYPDKDGKPDLGRPRGPCVRAADGGRITDANPCECIVALEQHRKKRQAAKDATAEARINKLAKLAEQTATANLNAANASTAAAEQLAAAAQALAAAAQAPRKEREQK